ncbi:MAG: DNA primase [Thermoanaerobaculia bacterium]|nr:DNA primase [Thermoanaerobaculia bacterium]
MALSNVQLTPQLVQAVRDAVRIDEIAGEHTRLRRAGQRATGLCPLHKEKTPSFSVDVNRGLFYCFGCGQGGDAIRLHMLLTGDDFPAAIESLAQRYGIPLPRRRAPRPGGREEPDLEPVLQAAEEFFRDRLRRAAGPRAYLEKRRIPEELVERFRLGYAPDAWRELRGALAPRVSIRELEAAGLLARSEKRPDDPYDRFRNRLIFPIRDLTGRLVGFGGRALGDDKVKYLNTSETARFRKGTILYGLDLAKREIRERGRVLLVEGYFDVLGAVAAGIEEAVASMGTALTAQQCRLMARFADETVIGYDGDDAGVAAARRALPLVLAAGLGARRVELGEGHDPDSLRLAEGDEELRKRIDEARDFVAAELERLIPRGAADEPRLQARAARDLTELLQPIPDRILRYGYVRLAAARLAVPDDLLWRRVSGGGSRATEEPTARRDEGRVVRSTEQQVIHLLLAGRAPLPGPDELPPAEAFHDPTCRNIYRAFLELYAEEPGERPAAQAVLERLGSGDDAVDQVARVLLEERGSTDSEDLRLSLGRINRRWHQRRLRELSAKIGDAQRAGDDEALRRLLEEKTSLSRRIHGAAE